MNYVEDITLDWFYARVVAQDDCLIWNCGCGGAGAVPAVSIGGVVMSVRRVVWRLANQKAVPDERRVLPSCGNRKCVHPDHMQALPKGYVFRGVKKTLRHKASTARAARARSKWTDEDIRAIAASTMPAKDIAQQYGMDASYVSKIRSNKCRVDFTNPYLQLLGEK